MRPGLGLDGVQNLLRFVEDGGLLVTARDTSVWAIEYGLARWVRVVDTTQAESARHDRAGHGHGQEASRSRAATTTRCRSTSPARRSSRVGFRDDRDADRLAPQRPRRQRRSRRAAGPPVRRHAGASEARARRSRLPAPRGRAVERRSRTCPRAEDRPRVVISFAEKDLLLSGMLEGGDEIAGKPAVIDVPRGKGHIILMSHQSDVAHEHLGAVRAGDERESWRWRRMSP